MKHFLVFYVRKNIIEYWSLQEYEHLPFKYQSWKTFSETFFQGKHNNCNEMNRIKVPLRYIRLFFIRWRFSYIRFRKFPSSSLFYKLSSVNWDYMNILCLFWNKTWFCSVKTHWIQKKKRLFNSVLSQWRY